MHAFIPVLRSLLSAKDAMLVSSRSRQCRDGLSRSGGMLSSNIYTRAMHGQGYPCIVGRRYMRIRTISMGVLILPVYRVVYVL